MPYPDEAFVVQAMRDLTNAIDGLLAGGCVLIRDRAGKWSRAVLALLEQEEVRIIRTPFRAPNCNAYAKRFVRSIKEESVGSPMPTYRWHAELFLTAATFKARLWNCRPPRR